MEKGRFPTAGKLKPSEYFQRQCWISTEHERELPMIIDLIGDDKIVFSTDYPHGDSDFPRCGGRVFGDGWCFEPIPKEDSLGTTARGCTGWANKMQYGLLE